MKENRHTPQWWRSCASKSINPVGFGFYKCWLQTMHHCNQRTLNQWINKSISLALKMCIGPKVSKWSMQQPKASEWKTVHFTNCVFLIFKSVFLFLQNVHFQVVSKCSSGGSGPPSSEWSNPLCQHSKPHNTQHTPDDFPIVHVFT